MGHEQRIQLAYRHACYLPVPSSEKVHSLSLKDERTVSLFSFWLNLRLCDHVKFVLFNYRQSPDSTAQRMSLT